MRNKTLVEYYISVIKRYSKKLLSITDIVAADQIEAKLRYALLERGCGEECVSHYYISDTQQFL